PLPAVRAAVGRRHPQRLHGEGAQQAAPAARVLAGGARAARRPALDPRPGAGRQHPRHHRRPARGARVRDGAACGACAARRGRDALPAGRPGRGLRARHHPHHPVPEGCSRTRKEPMSPTTLIARRPRGMQGRHVLVAFLAFFGTVFAVNGTLIYEAVSTHTGLVANEPYRKGLAYNARIGADERQARLGWTETLEVGRDGHVTFALAEP